MFSSDSPVVIEDCDLVITVPADVPVPTPVLQTYYRVNKEHLEKIPPAN